MRAASFAREMGPVGGLGENRGKAGAQGRGGEAPDNLLLMYLAVASG
jgi:hypothetical protein